MAFCRWSSDNFQCDLYCYENNQGIYCIEVATHRYVGKIPEKYDEQMEFFKKAKRKKIGLPYDGYSFREPNLEAFLKRLLELRKVGYKFPDYVLEMIKQELKLEKKGGKKVVCDRCGKKIKEVIEIDNLNFCEKCYDIYIQEFGKVSDEFEKIIDETNSEE